ncbi:MAG: LPS assembly lipoprotein LptE [bacterium]
MNAIRPDRRAVLVMLALAGCGFTPAFGTRGAAQKLMGTVRAGVPHNGNDFNFVRRIDERFGPPDVGLYDLSYSITTTSNGVAITPDGAITRYNLSGRLDWTLTRHSDGLRMAGGTFDTFTSYSATGSTVAGLAAREDAGRRLMVILADEVVARLTAEAAGFPA